MKRNNKYAIRVHNLTELAEGDRILIATPYCTVQIGYVESVSTDTHDGKPVVYVDTRWRKRRKAVAKWYHDNGNIPASNKFRLLFEGSVVFATNMKLKEAVARLGFDTHTVDIGNGPEIVRRG